MRRTYITRRRKLKLGLISCRLFLLLIISESSIQGFIIAPSIRLHGNNHNHKFLRDGQQHDYKRQKYYNALSDWNHGVVVVALKATNAVKVNDDIDKTPGNFSTSSSYWEAGDVYKDLENLECSIARSNAQQNLERHERLEMLNQFARERKVLSNDVYQYIGKPLFIALALTLLQLITTTTNTTFRSGWLSSGLATTIRLLGVFLDHVAMVHFRLIVLLTPILLWTTLIQRQKQRKIHARRNINNNDLPPELQGIDPEYYRFVVSTDWQDPRTTCQDHVLCLVEQWTSVIVGTVLVEGLMMCSTPFMIGTATATTTTTVARLLQQLVTRLAVVASLHQYPKLWFQLNNQTLQPKPVTWSTFALQTSISMLATPWFMTWNLSRLLFLVIVRPSSSLSSSFDLRSTLLVGLLYTLFATMLLAIKFRPPPPTTTTTGLQQQAKPPKWVTRNLPLLKRGVIPSTIVLLFLHCCWNPKLLEVIRMARTTTTKEFWEWLSTVALPASFASSSPWQLYTTISSTMLIFVPPLCHLVAATRLFRIQYTHDLSLANASSCSIEEFQQALQNKEQDRFQWRYRMNWREPQRIRTTLREWRRRLCYWFFFAGSVQEKLRRQSDTVAQRRCGGEVKRRGLTVAQRIKHDLGSAATLSLLTDRTKWKHQAMERLAKLHELSYQNGSFHDPLGIAIHRAFDIGLGFNFDHFRDIDGVSSVYSGESSLSPSTRRLQARAAKSALKRAQEIYTASIAQRELDQIEDPVQRNAKAQELRQQADNEIMFIARRLTELIPTDLNLGNSKRGMEDDDQLRPYELRDTFERKSANEYTLYRSQTIQNLSDLYASRRSSSASSSTEKDFMYEIDYLNPSGKKPSGNGSSDDNDKAPRQDSIDKDDEFIQEWLKNEQSRKDSTSTTTRDNDKDNDDRAVFA